MIQVVYQSVSREKMLGLLREHLRANLIRLNGRWYYQRRGIPQVCSCRPEPCLHQRTNWQLLHQLSRKTTTPTGQISVSRSLI